MKKYSPTTPSRRHMTVVDYSVLTKIEPMKSALVRIAHRAGRNHQGRITTRHQGGGVKQLYRMVDFKQNKIDIPARIEAIEYDPYRSAFIARALYNDGERRYILAGKGMKEGDVIITSANATVKEGNRSMLKNIPSSYMVYNIELQPGKGGQMAKSAGSYAQVLAHEGKYTSLKLPSGEVRKVLTEGYATMGQVSNNEHNLVNIGKAGRSRHLGIRPTVRGKAMNPCDHPHGGGEGAQPRGTKRLKTAWGKIAGGHKTRNAKKRSSSLIIKRRVSVRNK